MGAKGSGVGPSGSPATVLASVAELNAVAVSAMAMGATAWASVPAMDPKVCGCGCGMRSTAEGVATPRTDVSRAAICSVSVGPSGWRRTGVTS